MVAAVNDAKAQVMLELTLHDAEGNLKGWMIRTLGNQRAADATAQVILDLILRDTDGYHNGREDQDLR